MMAMAATRRSAMNVRNCFMMMMGLSWVMSEGTIGVGYRAPE
jgi:hypothetical protein